MNNSLAITGEVGPKTTCRICDGSIMQTGFIVIYVTFENAQNNLN